MARNANSRTGLARATVVAAAASGVLLISRPVVSADGDNSHWSAFGTASERGTSDIVTTLTVFGGRLTAGGFFYFAGREYVGCVAQWDGDRWLPLASGLLYGNPPPCEGWACSAWVSDFCTYDSSLVACGRFTKTGDTPTRPAKYVARWDGSAWHDIGGGMSDVVYDVEVFRGDLVATGKFRTAGDQPVNYIARWDGQRWLPLGSGLNAPGSHMTVFRDKLIVSGWFTRAGSAAAYYLAAWDGATWSDLGPVIGFRQSALGVYQDTLLATIADANEWPVLSKWDGTSWQRLSSTTPDAAVFTTYNGDLILGGNFTEGWGGGLGNYLARWDGTGWSRLGSGLDDIVLALAVHEGHLFVGGWFNAAGGKPSWYIARWDDIITPVLVEELAARPTDQGIEVAWRLSREAVHELRAIHVQRADHRNGPYADRTLEPLRPEPEMAFTDRDAPIDRPSWYRLRLVASTGQESTVGPVEVAVSGSPQLAVLYVPVDPGTDRPVSIRYRTGRPGSETRLEIFSVTGRLVRVLHQGFAPEGEHLVSWDRNTDAGLPVARGTYLVRLSADRASQAKKLVLLHR